jgi:hypothetical protein
MSYAGGASILLILRNNPAVKKFQATGRVAERFKAPGLKNRLPWVDHSRPIATSTNLLAISRTTEIRSELAKRRAILVR